jgi:hypothetical protein
VWKPVSVEIEPKRPPSSQNYEDNPQQATASHFKSTMSLRYTHQHRGVQHDYHDHSNDLDPGIEIVAERDASFTSGGAHPPPFPVRLHYVLDELAKDGLSRK